MQPCAKNTSIQEAKEPERYLVSKANLHVVVHDIVVVYVGNLREALSLPAYLEEKAAIHKKVAASRMCHVMHGGKLVEEERFATSTNIGFRIKTITPFNRVKQMAMKCKRGLCKLPLHRHT